MERILGIEGGGTKTSWMLFDARGGELQLLDDGSLAPTNFSLTSRERIVQIWREMPRNVEAVGAFLAGCGTPTDRAELTKLCAEVWPGAAIVTGSDRESGFASAFGEGDGIAVNAGTGSSITGRREGRFERAGGWGHVLGDAGGGYDLSLEMLRFVLRDYDLHRRGSELAQEVLRALGLNDLNELVRWAQTAGKMEIATLAPLVFAAGAAGHKEVNDILCAGARVLAEYTCAVADRLEFRAPPVALLGGLFRGHSIYVSAYRRELAELSPVANVLVAEKPSALGAAWLALAQRPPLAPHLEKPAPEIAAAATEGINPRSLDLENLSPRELVDLFVAEEKFVQEALRAAADRLAEGVSLVATALKSKGRLFYVGAGTSGRLGVLDASEIPPTFGAAPELVQGIIAGGAAAFQRSAEGAEDDGHAGGLAIVERGVRANDVVCGITASGRTPFVLGALRRARERGARTLLLTSNPAASSLPNEFDLCIVLPTGPELLAGSTRLKAGTATKVALNILSTGAMVQLGCVRGNLMVELSATNQKLRARAVRLLVQLTGCDAETARARLASHGWNLRAALAGGDAAG
ncbi:MAG TPA: N-acetylmuramic acid 6-phosphate etherase [Chthoniobacterales bacterium]|nr:N-acetylmuramic acid 6-phosphate etherase [Chthoniobacterales bacterium]